MAIIVRDAEENEYDRIESILLASYREYARYLEPQHWETMSFNLSQVSEIGREAQWIVAEDSQQIVGAIAYYRPGTSNSRLFEVDWASFRMLCVLPAHRGQGIGRILSVECIDRSKQDRAETIALHTSELMESAMRMYESLGFDRDLELPRSLGIRYWRYILRFGNST